MLPGYLEKGGTPLRGINIAQFAVVPYRCWAAPLRPDQLVTLSLAGYGPGDKGRACVRPCLHELVWARVQVSSMLDRLYSELDRLADTYGVFSLETIGDGEPSPVCLPYHLSLSLCLPLPSFPALVHIHPLSVSEKERS